MSTKQVKYHINPKTGRPNQCTATVKGCQFSKDGMVPEHYDTKEEARAAYEKQNKENTFSNTIKKNATNTENNNTILDENKDISDVFDNFVTYTNSPQILTFIKGKNFSEIRENIDKLHKYYEMSDRVTNKELEDEIREASEFNPKIRISKELPHLRADGDYTVEVIGHSVYFEKDEYKSYNDAVKNADKTNMNPLKDDQRELVNVYVNDTNNTDEDDYYDEDNNYNDVSVIETSYEYKLSDHEIKRLRNQSNFTLAEEYKEILDDPKKPDWMILPPQNNHRNRAAKSYGSSYDRTKDPYVNNKRLLQEKEELLSQHSKIEKQNERKMRELRRDYKGSLNRYSRMLEDDRVSDLEINNQKKRIKDASKTLKDAEERNNNDEKLNAIKESLLKIDKKVEENNKKIAENEDLKYEDEIAARYPSTDPKERRKAAQQWMKDNEKHRPFKSIY